MVEKAIEEGNNIIYQGTVINSDRCIAMIIATGEHAPLGKIGNSIITYSESENAITTG